MRLQSLFGREIRAYAGGIVKKLILPLLGAASLLIWSGCASNQSLREKKDRIVALENKQSSQEALLEMANKDIRDIRRNVAEIMILLRGKGLELPPDGRIPEQIAHIESSLDNMQSGLDQASSGVASRGQTPAQPSQGGYPPKRVDALDQTDPVSQALSTFRSEKARLSQILDQLNREIGNLPDPAPTSAIQPAVRNPKPASEKEITDQYWAALREYYRGNFENSIIMFEEFLKAYPNEDLSPNAHYWMAENYFSGANYQKSLREFQNTVALYPGHPKGLDAQLKVGISYYCLNDNANARQELSYLKQRYPGYERMNLVDKYLRLAK